MVTDFLHFKSGNLKLILTFIYIKFYNKSYLYKNRFNTAKKSPWKIQVFPLISYNLINLGWKILVFLFLIGGGIANPIGPYYHQVDSCQGQSWCSIQPVFSGLPDRCVPGHLVGFHSQFPGRFQGLSP